MDPLQLRVITIKNPEDEPFTFTYNKSISVTIPPGMAKQMPYDPLGILCIKHMIDWIAQRHKENYGDPRVREKWQAAIVLDDGADNTVESLTPEQVLQRKLDLLNQTNSSDMVKTCDTCGTKTFNLSEHMTLNHKGEAPVVAPEQSIQVESVSVPPAPVQPQTELQKQSQQILKNAVGSLESTPLPEQRVEEEEQLTQTPETKGIPTREELIAYARDTLKMDLTDARTMTAFEKMDIAELAKELNYNI